MEDDNLLAEVRIRSVIRMERSWRSGRRMTDTPNVLRLPEGCDSNHKNLFEQQHFIYTINCLSKNEVATFR